MKSCTLDGAQLPDAAAAYKELAAAFDAPAYFGANPDALWDVITEHSGEPIEIVWRHSARSAELLGPRFREIMTVLEKAGARGWITLRLE
jgi:RNAse (barnase) inhibitor barstar